MVTAATDAPDPRRRPRRLELGLRQRRLGQDPGADRPGRAAAARRHRAAAASSASPTPRPPPPRCRTACSAPSAPGRCSPTPRCARPSPTLGEPADDHPAGQLARARTLFARALETPGGLKIQTIHAFCEALLRRFPLEAGVAPRFAVLEDRQARALREEVLDALAAAARPTSRALARQLPGDDPDPLLLEIAQHRAAFAAPVRPRPRSPRRSAPTRDQRGRRSPRARPAARRARPAARAWRPVLAGAAPATTPRPARRSPPPSPADDPGDRARGARSARSSSAAGAGALRRQDRPVPHQGGCAPRHAGADARASTR